MRIVIDIDEEIYRTSLPYKDTPPISNKANDYPEMLRAVANGTPLPKGHGDLIDRSEVIKSLFDYHNEKKTIGQCIDDVQTIIEADAESEES